MTMYLTQGLHRALKQQPNAIASVYCGRRRTYAELALRVAKLASALCKLGMRRGDRAGILALNSDRYLEYYLGVYWAGGAVNPVNVHWSGAEIAYLLDDSGTRILLVDDQTKSLAADLPGLSKSLCTLIYAGDDAVPAGMLSYEAMLAETEPMEDACRSGDDLAGVFYTSGTTGFPKGVMLSHANVYTNALSLLAEGMVAHGCIGLHAAAMFQFSDCVFMHAMLLRGACHVIIPSFSPLAMLEAVEQEKVSECLLLPAMLQRLVDHPDLPDYDLSSLNAIMYGADRITDALIDRATSALPAVRFYQVYGMTETAPVVTVLAPYYHTRAGRKQGKTGSAGRATFCAEVCIVDSLGKEVPTGAVGEIAVRSPGVMLGYLNKPLETAAVVRGGWMHTGDGGYMDEDGFVYMVDRIKDMIISGGENVYSAEVENAVLRHPAVALCAVIGVPDSILGERVHAVIVSKPGAAATEEEIGLHCKALIADYKCPRSVEFRDALPLSGAGKVLKAKLRALYW
ncbi:MAG: fatty-acid--CoA ligase [Massilia sp.]|nr:fatty-acid--CoA ligase [Massilia sp.]MDB5952552.1 fatty-acid--CoA ligase [Massilia sp.]